MSECARRSDLREDPPRAGSRLAGERGQTPIGPHLSEKLLDRQTGAVVYEAEWDVFDSETRVLYENRIQPLQLGRDYTLWLSFNKPMRWRIDGARCRHCRP